MNTIFALASGAGKAGVAVIRISGTKAADALAALGVAAPTPRKAELHALRTTDGTLIDHALTLWFPAPHSFTGEDVAELHVHGSRAVIDLTLDYLSKQPGCRLAEAGEFSRRAFNNDKLDLTRMEALADLIDATTSVQHAQAIRQLDGALYEQTETWRGQLIAAMAYLEAYVDFPDEEIPEEAVDDLKSQLAELEAALSAQLNTRLGERIRDGFTVALVGAPNAGKSTLLNALVGRDAAIVSDTPGTTRDVLEVQLDLAGYPVTLYDTAGLRDSDDDIEQEGVRRARARAESADIVLHLVDASSPESVQTDDARSIRIASKSDLASGAEGLAISAQTGAGIDTLIDALETRVTSLTESGERPLFTRERHRMLAAQTFEAVERARAALSADQPLELVAEDLRLAASHLGKLTGLIDVEDVLDSIFTSFCIGK